MKLEGKEGNNELLYKEEVMGDLRILEILLPSEPTPPDEIWGGVFVGGGLWVCMWEIFVGEIFV